MASPSAAMAGGRILIATVRPRRVSSAFHTSPIPPAPICEIRRYEPRVVSGVSTGIIVGALVAAITFVSPQQGSQAVGVLPIEMTTNIAAGESGGVFVCGALGGGGPQGPPPAVFH